MNNTNNAILYLINAHHSLHNAINASAMHLRTGDEEAVKDEKLS